MDFTAELTVPANTAEADAEELEVELAAGRVTRVWIFLPWGHAALAHYQVFHRLQQVWPAGAGDSYAGNDTVIEFPEDYDLSEPPHVLKLRGWNTDDRYEHRAFFRFTMDTQAQVLIAEAQIGLLGRLARRMGIG